MLAITAAFWSSMSLSACAAGDNYARDAKAAAIPPSSSPAPIGVFVGAGKASRLTSFERKLGRPVTYAADYIDKRSWRSMQSVHWLGHAWRKRFAAANVLTVPMLPDHGKATMADGAAGRLNRHFRTMGTRLVKAGLGQAVLRIGPEFNGRWYRWTMARPRGAQQYAAYFRNIVKTFRSVKGAQFKFDWCPNGGSAFRKNGKSQYNPGSAYPGDAYVDYIGLDVFDQSWAPGSRKAAARWRELVTMKSGLAWHARFAQAHGKPMSFPEWGLVDRKDGHGGGDNPYFVQQMFKWFQTHQTAYHVYFESGDPNAEYGVFSGRFPRASVNFVNYFGSGAQTAATQLVQSAAPATG